MSKYPRKIEKSFNKLASEMQDGLSTYDIQLLALRVRRKKMKRVVIAGQLDELLAA